MHAYQTIALFIYYELADAVSALIFSHIAARIFHGEIDAGNIHALSFSAFLSFAHACYLRIGIYN